MADSSAAEKSTSNKRSLVQTLQPFLEFFIGIFGAMAIIGVFFKIQGYPNSEIFMILGFMGEALAFIIMGSFALLSYFLGEDKPGTGAREAQAVALGQQQGGVPVEAAQGEVRASARKMMEEKVSDDLNRMMGALGDEVERFGGEIREMTGEMERTRGALGQMHETLGRVADGGLAEQAHAVGDGMEQLSAQLRESGERIQGAQTSLERMEEGLNRAASGTLPEDAERLTQGMKALGEEVHAMSSEMGPARQAVEHMRGELEQITSGHLAADAERLGEGMSHLGGEMEGAGHAVESVRADLDEMAARFRQFNKPAAGDPSSNGTVSSQQHSAST